MKNILYVAIAASGSICNPEPPEQPLPDCAVVWIPCPEYYPCAGRIAYCEYDGCTNRYSGNMECREPISSECQPQGSYCYPEIP